MSIEKVREYFKTVGIEDRILEFSVSSATVALAAEALGCEPERIAKTLSFVKDDGCILVVAAGDARVDNAKFKAEFEMKAKMADYGEVARLCGHAAGGVCPFAVNEGVPVYLDASLKRFDFVYPAAGSSNSAIKLSIEELEKYSNFVKWVDVTKLPE